ncbi:hypothetical protein ACHAWX_006314 [Stephanocyclus meneghinianus]
MSTTEEATINPDGSTTFQDPDPTATKPDADDGSIPDDMPTMDDESAEEIVKGIDPAIYLALAVVAFAIIFVVLRMRRKRASADVDDFFSNLDGEKFDIKLPAAVDEYYEVKAKCEADGWVPGTQAPSNPPSQQHRLLAQALMKRCMADIPIVTHIQRESAGMNKLYSQSMCSVKQWKSYQAAEALVSAEVEEVRAEADEVEPGWSQVIWRQAMQYHTMMKQKEEQAKQAHQQAQQAQHQAILEQQRAAQAERAKIEKEKAAIQAEKDRIAQAEKVAAELLKQEEREQEAKKGFKGVKKGFLDSKK